MLCRVEDVLLSSLCRFSSASFAFFAKISSLRACIVSATHAHIGEKGVRLWSVSLGVLEVASALGKEILELCYLDNGKSGSVYRFRRFCLKRLKPKHCRVVDIQPRTIDHVQRSPNSGCSLRFSPTLKRKLRIADTNVQRLHVCDNLSIDTPRQLAIHTIPVANPLVHQDKKTALRWLLRGLTYVLFLPATEVSIEAGILLLCQIALSGYELIHFAHRSSATRH